MKDAVAHKRCNSAEPADRKADFSGAALARPTIRGMGHVNRKTILITAGLEAEAGDLHRREAAWNAGVRIVVRVAATSVSPLAKVVVDAPVGFERHLRLLDYFVISVGRRLPPLPAVL